MPHTKRKRVPDHRSDVLRASLYWGSPAHHRNTDYPKLKE